MLVIDVLQFAKMSFFLPDALRTKPIYTVQKKCCFLEI